MTDESALLTAIRESPDDDAPRLVYADLLDEHHQPERAEFIRVQIALARSDHPALRSREAELLAEHHDALAGPLAAPHLRFRFERGWPVAFGHNGVFARRYKEGASGRLPLAAAWYRLLRFHPDGRVQVGSARLCSLAEATTVLRTELDLAEPGVYTLNTDLHPPELRISMPRVHDVILGRMKKNSLLLEVSLPIYGRKPPTPGRYAHHPIPDFHSFPET